jgi:hypothetical protein
MGADSGNGTKKYAVFRSRDFTRWALAIFAATSIFATIVWARAFLYKGGEPGELQIWALSTVAGVITGTMCAPPQRSRAARSFFIGLAVSVSLLALLGDVALRHTLSASTDFERLLGTVIGGIAGRLILHRA